MKTLCLLLSYKQAENTSLLYDKILYSLKNHPIYEISEDDSDNLLQGFLNLLLTIVRNYEIDDKRIDELFTLLDRRIFFKFEDTNLWINYPQAKNIFTRSVSFELLTTISLKSEKHTQLLLHQISSIHQVIFSSFTPYTLQNDAGYVGLKNVGCLCYMNALLQQFFMIPKFRKDVLQIRFPSIDPSTDFITQLQSLFAYLQESEAQDYDTTIFLKAMRDIEGNCINPMLQQDAGEFLTNFFQHCENALGGTQVNSLIKNYFGIKMINELYTDDGRYSSHPEDCYTIILSVKGIENLEDSLQHFISHELVDYEWDHDDLHTTIQTKKRMSIKTLPPYLFFTLKRFEFNYTTMEIKKINSIFTFPEELDMRKYTDQYRPDKLSSDNTPQSEINFMYKLHGVVVHSGNSEAGHYYSFIKTRLYHGTRGRRWFEFNDSHVAKFDPSEIPEQCFGWKKQKNMRFEVDEKEYSAFILVYDRIDVDETPGVTESYDTNICNSSIIARKIDLESDLLERMKQKVEIQQNLIININEDNIKFNYLNTRKKYVIGNYYQILSEFLINSIKKFRNNEQICKVIDPLIKTVFRNLKKSRTEFLLRIMKSYTSEYEKYFLVSNRLILDIENSFKLSKIY